MGNRDSTGEDGGSKLRCKSTIDASGDEEKEAEFDDKKASIRPARSGAKGPSRGKGGNSGVGDDLGHLEDEATAEATKGAQALLDGACMSIVRVLMNDLHVVLGR